MKTFIFFIFLSGSCFAQHSYTINVDIANSDGKMIYLTNGYGGPLDRTKAVITDSLISINNKCTFSGSYKETIYYSIAVGSKKNYVSFIIDTGKIYIQGNAGDYFWKSAKITSLQNNLERNAKPSVDSIEVMREKFQDSLIKYQKSNKILFQKYSKLIDLEDQSMASFLLSYVEFHPNCYYAFYTLKGIYKFTPVVTELAKKIFPLFDPTIKNTEEGRYLYSHLFKKETGILRNSLPKMTLYNTKNTKQELQLNFGFTYLIDYWASWCIPCIANLPALKKMEKKFKNKNFKIISISLDNNYKKWMQSVKRNEIYWQNYSGLNGFNSTDAKFFNIDAIPFTVLINKKNIVTKINPTNKEIENYLMQL